MWHKLNRAKQDLLTFFASITQNVQYVWWIWNRPFREHEACKTSEWWYWLQKSEKGLGSSFKFYVAASQALPPHRASAHSGTTPEKASTVSQRNKSCCVKSGVLSVLLVEDNIVNQRVLKKQLIQQGSMVYTADDGQLALDLIAKTRTRPCASLHTPAHRPIDVILMDIEMPVMNGLQCTRRIRAIAKQEEVNERTPIIAVTANAWSDQLQQAIEAGMDDTISKPFRVNELVALIEQVTLCQESRLCQS